MHLIETSFWYSLGLIEKPMNSLKRRENTFRDKAASGSSGNHF